MWYYHCPTLVNLIDIVGNLISLVITRKREEYGKVKRVNHQSLPAVILMSFGALIILGSLFWFQTSSGRQEQATVQVQEDIPYPEIERVSLADAKAAFDLGTAIFIDVRDDSSYEQDHIPRALSIPLNRLPQELDKLDSSKWYILYCT